MTKFFRKLLSPIKALIRWIIRINSLRLMKSLYLKGKQITQSDDLILFWIPGGMPMMLHLESAIAAALKIRGHNVHAIICDGVFSACVKREISNHVPIKNWSDSCDACRQECSAVLKSMDIPYSYIGDYVSEKELSDLKQEANSVKWNRVNELKYHDISIGSNIQSAVHRYLKGNNLSDEHLIVKEYSFSGLVCAAASEHMIEKLKPTKIFMSHGTYVDWGPALHTALYKKIPVSAWMASYLPARFYFCHIDDGVHIDFHKMSRTAWNEISKQDFTLEQNARLDQFLLERYTQDSSFDMKHFMQYSGNVDELRTQYGFDSTKPVWGIMAHINWDAVSDYSPMVYDSFNDWMHDTIHVIRDITNVQWVIKVHPAEAWDNPESGVEYLINDNFPDLPAHIRVLPAEENISPLDFFNMIDGGVTVYGTAGLELVLHGKPVILAGEAHYGRKGFTYDSDNQEQYHELLKQAEYFPSINDEQRELARKYAHCYFIYKQIPISVVNDPNVKWWNFQFDKKELLLEGNDPAIDFVCEKILDGKDFIMSEPLLRLADKNMGGQA